MADLLDAERRSRLGGKVGVGGAKIYDMMTIMTRMTTKHRQGHGRGTWAVAEAKAIQRDDQSRASGWSADHHPQGSKGRGRRVGRGMAAQDQRRGNLAEFFAASPLRGSDLRIKRSKDGPREMEL